MKLLSAFMMLLIVLTIVSEARRMRKQPSRGKFRQTEFRRPSFQKKNGNAQREFKQLGLVKNKVDTRRAARLACLEANCCKVKFESLVSVCYLVSPLLSGILSFGILAELFPSTPSCTSTSLVTATANLTATILVTDTATDTSTVTTTNTVQSTSVISGTISTSVTEKTTLTASTTTMFVMVDATATTNILTTVTISRTDCNNGRRKRVFTQYLEEDEYFSPMMEKLENGPGPSLRQNPATLNPSFTD